jgi:hypothetical protein
LGDIIDSNLLPTLLLVEPTSATVSTFPVNKFYLPITKSTQLSFLIFLSSFLTGLAEIKRGDSQLGYDFFPLSYGKITTSPSYS